MSKLIIKGPSRLHGTVRVSGSKNAALPSIAATVLVDGSVTLKNIPDITDVQNLLLILEKLGSKISFSKGTLKIDNAGLRNETPDERLVRKIRASILLIPPLLIRNKRLNFSAPGGCFIGNRPLDAHFRAFEKFGIEINEGEEAYELAAEKLHSSEITLSEMSVTATENAIFFAVLAKGKTTIKMAACEPHVKDLCYLLCKMGAKISGIGTHELAIEGVRSLKPCEYEIIGDEIEAGTYIVAAAATNSELTVTGLDPEKMTYSILSKCEEANVRFKKLKDGIKVEKSLSIKPIKIWVAPAPHFPTDLQAPFAVLATQATGTTLIHENMYEGRLNYLKELRKMGANASILDPHRAAIIGPTKLEGKRITSLDLRAGATLIIAALVAEGVSEIDDAEIIDRGYEDIVNKFQKLGVNIRRVE